MAMSARKGSERRRPSGEGEEVRTRLTRALLDKLDAWIDGQPAPRPSRSQAIQRILAESLTKPLDAGSISAEDLNASNDE